MSNIKVFASFDDLKRIGAEPQNKKTFDSARLTKSEKDTFLSHSSKDNEMLPAVVAILENHGARVYIDNTDESLPINPSVKTAEILRSNLRNTKKFVLFVTTNSKDSIWIPWELGVADGEKRPANVALFPSAEGQYEQSWSEQEYLGLYRRIIWANLKGEEKPQWLVYDHHNNTAISLYQWLHS
jgi:hypothetical protein